MIAPSQKLGAGRSRRRRHPQAVQKISRDGYLRRRRWNDPSFARIHSESAIHRERNDLASSFFFVCDTRTRLGKRWGTTQRWLHNLWKTAHHIKKKRRRRRRNLQFQNDPSVITSCSKIPLHSLLSFHSVLRYPGACIFLACDAMHLTNYVISSVMFG